MKKHLLSLLTAVVLMLTTGSAYAQTFQYTHNVQTLYYAPIDATTARVVQNTGITDAVEIPAIVSDGTTTFTVTELGDEAFYNCTGLTSVILPDGLTRIGADAFSNCRGLTSITLPDGITSIESYTFLDCSGLTSLTLPDGITSIESYTFLGCSGLTSIILPDGITSIGIEAFRNCSALTSITFPYGLTDIDHSAFQGCTALENITIQVAAPPTLGPDVFDGATSISNIYVPPGSVGDYQSQWPPNLSSFFKEAYIVTLEDRGGLFSVSLTVPVSSPTTIDAAPTVPGYTIEHWYDVPTNGSPIVFPFTVTSNKILYAQSSPTGYTITLDAQGGTVSPGTLSVTYKTAVGALPTATPATASDAFLGWFTTPTGGWQYTDATIYRETKDTTLYAHRGAEHKITFDENGGDPVTPSTLTVHEGVAVGTLPSGTRAGYEFLGWFDEANLPNPKQYIKTSIYNQANNITLTARWAVRTSYTITFDVQGGDNLVHDRMYINQGDQMGTLPTPTRAGNNFDGWFDAPTGGIEYINTTTFNAGKHTTLYARWTVETYKITLDISGGGTLTGGTGPHLVTYNERVDALSGPIPQATRSDFVFGGWFDGTTLYADTTIYNKVAGDITVTPRWDIEILFDANGGAPAFVRDTILNDGASKPIAPTAPPSRTGFIFDGWHYDPATDTPWDTDSIFLRNDTIYAHWVVAYTVTFDSRGGSAVPNITNVPTGSTIAAPANPTYAGYTFNGWYSNAAGTNAWNFAAHTVTSDTTLYARWTQNPPPVISVSGVSLSPTVISLTEGTTATLYASVMPSNATTTSVTWTSSNTAVATVTNQGIVTAIAPGTATITVTTNDGGYKATAVVTVTPAASGVGNASVDNAKLAAYPNPTDGIVTIAGLTPGSVLRLYNITGTQVALYTATDATMVINIGNLPHGLYYVRTDGHTLRLIKK